MVSTSFVNVMINNHCLHHIIHNMQVWPLTNEALTWRGIPSIYCNLQMHVQCLKLDVCHPTYMY